jgi:hypothetical protein
MPRRRGLRGEEPGDLLDIEERLHFEVEVDIEVENEVGRRVVLLRSIEGSAELWRRGGDGVIAGAGIVLGAMDLARDCIPILNPLNPSWDPT